MAFPVHLVFIENKQVVEHSFFWNFQRIPVVDEVAIFFDRGEKKIYKVGAVCPLIRREDMICLEHFIFLERVYQGTDAQQPMIAILESLNPPSEAG